MEKYKSKIEEGRGKRIKGEVAGAIYDLILDEDEFGAEFIQGKIFIEPTLTGGLMRPKIQIESGIADLLREISE